MPPPELPAALSPEAHAALIQFADEVAGALGENLVAIVLYGGVAKGRFEPLTSDLNVLLVLRDASLEALDRVAEAANLARRTARLELLTVAEADLPDCTEVFATKFRDIQEHHVVIRGRDVLTALPISRERLLRQARRELLNLKLRLRQAWMQRGSRPETLAVALDRGRKTVRVNLAALLAGDDGNPALKTVLQHLESVPPVSQAESAAALFRDLEAALGALGPA